jgi:hypothetical protein
MPSTLPSTGKVPTGIENQSIRASRSPSRPPKGGPPLAGEDPEQGITLKDKSTSNDG